MKQIPVERVWEVHLAGGFEMDGFYLDAHSGSMPDKLIEIAREVVAQLPNLKAITYELLPSYIPIIGLHKIETEILKVRDIWDCRPASADEKLFIAANEPNHISIPSQALNAWEESLGALAIGKEGDNMELAQDPAIPVVQKLIGEFRASMLITVYRLTCRFLMLTLGKDVFRSVLQEFWKQFPPKQFASEEALNFSQFLKTQNFKIPNLAKVLEFEECTLLTLLDNENRVIQFDHDPFPLLRSLSEGSLPTLKRQPGNYEIEITGDTENGELTQQMLVNFPVNH
jgi:hypothetical protein